MPVHVVRDGDEHCIEDDQGKRHGKCHATAGEAQAQARAINANLDKEVANGLVDNIIRRVNEILGKGDTRPRDEVPCTDCNEEADATPQVKAHTGIMTWKGDDGKWYWLARYSNSFRDDDRPKQEIISAQSHKTFVKNVDDGLWGYPELWYWHEKSWKWGDTTWLAFDEVEPGKGFSLAGGPVDEGKEWMAEKIAEAPVPHGVSHGMPSEYIVRNKSDSTVYDEHRTIEISPLPLDRAANKYTGIQVFTKENDIMALSDEKRQQAAASLGASEEALRLVEQSNAEAAKAADAEGREFKEVGEAEPQVEQPEVELEATPQPEPAEEKQSPDYLTRKDFDEFATELTRGFTDAMKIVTESIETLRAELKQVQEDKEELEKSMTPAASIYSHILSAVGGQQVKQVSDLEDQKPKETAPFMGTGRSRNPGIAFLSQMEEMNKRAAGVSQ